GIRISVVDRETDFTRGLILQNRSSGNLLHRFLARCGLSDNSILLGKVVNWRPTMAGRDPVELEIFKNIFHSIAEEMGAALRRTAFSPNIKERRDYSCAVFDAAGEVIAMGDHMPVHLGSMPMSVRAAIDALPLGRGDVVMLNDPFRGGTHLPDITLVAPIFIGQSRKPEF